MSDYIDPAIVKPGDVIEYRHKNWPEGDFVRATARDAGYGLRAAGRLLRYPDGTVTGAWLDGILVILSHTPAPRALPTKVGTVIDATVTRNRDSKRTRLMRCVGGWVSSREVGGHYWHSPEHIGSDWVLVVDGEGE